MSWRWPAWWCSILVACGWSLGDAVAAGRWVGVAFLGVATLTFSACVIIVAIAWRGDE